MWSFPTLGSSTRRYYVVVFLGVVVNGFNITLVNPGQVEGQWLPLHQDAWNAGRLDCLLVDINDTPELCLGGVFRFAKYISDLRTTHGSEHVLIAAPGEFVSGTLFNHFFDGVAARDILNMVGLNATTAGYRERGTARDTRNLTDGADFSFVVTNMPLGANVVPVGTTKSKVYTIGGNDVAFVALSALPVQPVDELSKALRSEVALLNYAGVRVIILLTAAVSADDTQVLVHNVAGLSAVITGKSPEQVAGVLGVDPESAQLSFVGPSGNPVPVLSARGKFENIVTAFLSFGGNGVLEDFSIVRTVLDQSFDDENVTLYNATRNLVYDFYSVIESDSKPVGAVAALMYGTKYPCRYFECDVGNFVANASRWLSGAQIAVWNAGGFRRDIAAGPVTLADILNVSPFQNHVVMFSVNGSVLLNALEWGVRLAQDPTCVARDDCVSGTGAFLQVSGMRFMWSPFLPSLQRVTSVDVMIDGEFVPLSYAATYTIATNNYIGGGGDGFEWGLADDPSPPEELGEVRFEDLLIRYFHYRDEVIPLSPPGRITTTELQPPRIEAIAPLSASSGGNYFLTITGSNFYDSAVFTAMLGDVECTTATASSNTTMTCLVGDMTLHRDQRVRLTIISSTMGPSLPSIATIFMEPGCPPFAILDDTAECICRSGYSSTSTAPLVCTACPAGYFKNTDANSACEPCAQGHFSRNASTRCDPCPENSYARAPGSPGCMVCPANSQSNFDSTGCKCIPGLYSPSQDSFDCLPCPKGAECKSVGTVTQSLSVQKGYWRPDASSATIYQCADDGACNGGAGPHNCAQYREGLLCDTCSSGAAACGGSCKECDGIDWPVTLVFFLGGLILACVLLLSSWPSPVMTLIKMAIDFYQMAFLLLPDNSPLFSVIGMANLGVTQVEGLKGFPCFTCMSPLQDAMAPCFVPMALVGILMLVALVWVTASLLVENTSYQDRIPYLATHKEYFQGNGEDTTRLLELAHNSSTNQMGDRGSKRKRFSLRLDDLRNADDMLSHMEKEHADKKERQRSIIMVCKARTVHAVMRVIILTWAVTCKSLLNLVNCYTVHDKFVMRTHPAVECYQGAHVSAAVFAFCGILTYLVVFPLAFWRFERKRVLTSMAADFYNTLSVARLVLTGKSPVTETSKTSAKRRKSISTTQNQEAVFPGRYQVFRDGFEGFDAVILCRRTVFVFMAVLSEVDSAAQTLIIVLYLLMCAVAHYRLEPYLEPRDNALHFGFIEILIILAAIKAGVNDGNGTHAIYHVFTTIVLVLPALWVIISYSIHFYQAMMDKTKIGIEEDAEAGTAATSLDMLAEAISGDDDDEEEEEAAANDSASSIDVPEVPPSNSTRPSDDVSPRESAWGDVNQKSKPALPLLPRPDVGDTNESAVQDVRDSPLPSPSSGH